MRQPPVSSASAACRGVELKVPSVSGSLPIVRAVIEKIALAQELGEKDTADIGLAIDEALANVIKHGYAGQPDQPIVIGIEVAGEKEDRRLIVTIRDFGRQVDPARIQGRSLDDVRPGGLGVHIMRSVMDEVEYSCPDCGGMLVRMVKRIGRIKP